MTRTFLAFGLILASLPARAGTFAQFQASTPSVTCSQATTYLARTSGGNEGGNSANITTLICGLVTDGVITGNLSTTGCGPTPTSLDALYILAQQNSTDALLNICRATYNATLTGAPTFTTFKGYSAFTTGALIGTNFNAASATSPNYVENSANYGVWSYAVVNETVAVMGTHATGAVGESNMYTDFSGTSFYGRINSVGGSSGPVTQPGTKGLFVAERTSSSATTLYWDGISQGGVTDTSGGPASFPFVIGSVTGAGGATAQTICEAHIGAALGATLNLALYNRLRTYMTAVGVP